MNNNSYYNEIYYPYDEHSNIRASWEDEIQEIEMTVKQKNKDFGIYVIGHSQGYGSWIQGHYVKDMKDADVVVLTGGEDISPKLYNEPAGKSTGYSYGGKERGDISTRDAFEVEEYYKALSLGKAIWGTCRGAQLLCAMAGGKLIQDMQHWSTHKLHFYDKEYSCSTNTLHHQMQYPYPIPSDQYTILAHSHGLSPYYLGGDNKPMYMPEKTDNGVIKEPEFVYYSKIKGLGIQGHPEMMGRDSDLTTVCHAYLNLMIEGHIDQALKLNIPVKDILSRAWNFSFTEEENQLYKQVTKKVSSLKAVAEIA